MMENEPEVLPRVNPRVNPDLSQPQAIRVPISGVLL